MGFDEMQKQVRKLMKDKKPKTESIDGELSKSQRIILLYIDITSKIEKKKSLSKKEIKDGIHKELEENLDTKSLHSLVRKNILEDHDGSFCLSDDGKDISRELLQDIKEKYGDADWDIIKKYFGEQTIKPLSVDKWVREYQKLPENIQDSITHLSDNIKRKKTVSYLTKEFIEILHTDPKIRKIIDDRFKYNATLVILSNRYTPKTVDLEELLHKEPLEKDEQKRLERIAKINFRSPNLTFLLKREFDKDHVGDPKGKLTSFLVCCSGKLPPKYRVSMALRGDSSVGKTNLMKTVLKHLPKHWYAFGTRFTRATLEDDVEPFYIVVFSEKTQDTDVVESLKQLSEDGLQTWKKDKETNKLRDVKFIDRKASIYSSTEKETDEELATRYIVYSVIFNPEKTESVINSISLDYSDGDLQIAKELRENKPTWITVGLGQLKEFDKYEIPYAYLLAFNKKRPRFQRDVKRFYNLICTNAWLHQDNRHSYTKDGKTRLVVSVDDFYWIAYLTEDIFKQTLSNIDRDIDLLITTYEDMVKNRRGVVLTEDPDEVPLDRRHLDWVRKNDLAQELGICNNTLMKRLDVIDDKNILEKRSGKTGGGIKHIAITGTPDKITLLKFNVKKTYLILKNIEERLFKERKFNYDFKKIKKNGVLNKLSKKFLPGNVTLNIYIDFDRLKISLKHQKGLDKGFNEIIRSMNEKMKRPDKETDFDFDEFEVDDIDWNV